MEESYGITTTWNKWKDIWDLSTIYPTDQAWEEALKDLTEKSTNSISVWGTSFGQRRQFAEITEFSLNLERQVEKLYVYAHMKNDQDTREAKYQKYYAKAMTLYSQLEQAFSFCNLSLWRLGKSSMRPS